MKAVGQNRKKRDYGEESHQVGRIFVPVPEGFDENICLFLHVGAVECIGVEHLVAVDKFLHIIQIY
jgi:hypothetical protein